MSTPNGPSDVAPPPLRPKSLVDKSSGFMKTIERNQYEVGSLVKRKSPGMFYSIRQRLT